MVIFVIDVLLSFNFRYNLIYSNNLYIIYSDNLYLIYSDILYLIVRCLILLNVSTNISCSSMFFPFLFILLIAFMASEVGMKHVMHIIILISPPSTHDTH